MAVPRKWQIFPGQNRFCFDGRLMMSRDCGIFFLTLILILGTSSLFFIFDSPFLWTEVSPAIPVVAAMLLLSTLSNLFATSFSDPGILPRATKDEIVFDERQAYLDSARHHGTPAEPATCLQPPPRFKEIVIDGKRNHVIKLKYCFTCKIFRPPRSSHCSVCDNCVDRFDHHCPWVGNCVGGRNYRHFYMFLLSLALLVLIVLISSVAHLVLIGSSSSTTGSGGRLPDRGLPPLGLLGPQNQPSDVTWPRPRINFEIPSRRNTLPQSDENSSTTPVIITRGGHHMFRTESTMISSSSSGPLIRAVRHSPFSIIVIVICFFSLWSVLGLVGFHTYLAMSNVTTNEDIKGNVYVPVVSVANDKNKTGLPPDSKSSATVDRNGDQLVSSSSSSDVPGRSRRADEVVLLPKRNPFATSNPLANFVNVLCTPVKPSLIDRRGVVTEQFVESNVTFNSSSNRRKSRVLGQGLVVNDNYPIVSGHQHHQQQQQQSLLMLMSSESEHSITSLPPNSELPPMIVRDCHGEQRLASSSSPDAVVDGHNLASRDEPRKAKLFANRWDHNDYENCRVRSADEACNGIAIQQQHPD